MDQLNHYETSSTSSSSSSSSNLSQLLPAVRPVVISERPKRPPSPTLLLSSPARKKPQYGYIDSALNTFPVHISIPIPDPAESTPVRRLLNRLEGHARLALVDSAVKPHINRVHNLHVSLSRPVRIKKEQIPVILRNLRCALAEFKRTSLVVTDVVVPFLGEDRSRTYLAAVIQEQDTCPVLSLIRTVDRVYAGLGLHMFFEDARPHVSFAWLETGAIAECLRLKSNPTAFDGAQCEVSLHRVECKIGICTYAISLLP
jgi:hypothetical protein